MPSETDDQKQQYKFIIQSLSEGDTYFDIADNTGEEPRFIRKQIDYLLRRYKARTKEHLIAMAFRKGVIE